MDDDPPESAVAALRRLGRDRRTTLPARAAMFDVANEANREAALLAEPGFTGVHLIYAGLALRGWVANA